MGDELKKFTDALNSLTSNDKYIINTLSMIALEVKDNPVLSKEIAKLAIGNIYKSPSKMKLVSFYVVDSIVKNVGTPYKEMFSEIIVDAFLHTFQSNKDHDIRLKLYNLRITWKQFFPSGLQNKLDVEVKKLDPAWPLVLQADYKNKNEKKQNTTSSPDSTTTNDSTRDPRVNKSAKKESETLKRKASSDDLFLIDRDGDNQIKRKVREAAKGTSVVKPTSDSNSTISNGFKPTKDLDLRVHQIESNHSVKSETTSDENKKSWTPNDLLKFLNEKNNNISNGGTSNETSLQPPNSVNTRMQSSNLPKPREPIWKIKVDGFPQFPQIGTDPRLLARCPFYDPFRTITIDGNKYLLYLDRIQPCIYVNNELHAVRFYCQSIEVHINGISFQMSSNHLTHIKINRRAFIACLGGPGHELIINGWPYNVRIDGNLHQIKVGGYPVTVQFFIRRPIQVNVQNVIPPYICDWAVKGYFGSPLYLSMPPLNPLRNSKLRDQRANLFRHELGVHRNYRTPQLITDKTTLMPSTSLPAVTAAVTSISSSLNFDQPKSKSNSNNINVHDLFQKLVDTGIITPSKSKDLKLDITKYSWDNYKDYNEKEIDELYSGHQCDLCGTRFKSKESKEFELHLDYHFYKNTTNFTTNKVSRNYYSSSNQWLIGVSVRVVEKEFNFEQTSDVEQKFRCPMFEDQDRNKCAVCMENFEVEWDDEEEKFMLQDGRIHEGKAYHPICLEDADKQIEARNARDNEQHNQHVELTNQPHEALQKVLQGEISDVVLPEKSHTCEDISTDGLGSNSGTELDYQSATADIVGVVDDIPVSTVVVAEVPNFCSKEAPIAPSNCSTETSGNDSANNTNLTVLCTR